MNTRFKTLLFLIIAGCAFIIPQNVFAQEDLKKWFDKDVSYDIYIGNDDHGITVIKDIMIGEFVTIGDKLFVTIRTADFSFNKSKGFVAFENIKAILPHEKIRAIQRNTNKINFR